MKKCPEKLDLFKVLDPELDSSSLSGIEEHLKSCESCRAELAAVKAFEQGLRRNSSMAFAGNSIKSRVMADVRSLKPEPVADSPGKKSFWLWVLAPGLLIIMFAALVTSLNKPVVRSTITFQASAAESKCNDMMMEIGKVVDLGAIVSPMKLNGKFVFTFIASGTSTIEHDGSSEIVSVKNGELVFATADATFRLLSGNPVKILVNGIVRFIDEKPVKILSEASKALELLKPEINNVVPPANDVASKSQTCLASEAKLNVPEICASAPSEVTSTSAFVEEIDEQSASGSEKTQPTQKNVNPFLDNPVDLNGN